MAIIIAKAVNNYMYRIIACDLDETLLNNQGAISEGNLRAIKSAQELGVKFVPATGRGYSSVGDLLSRLGLADMAGEYVISFNGGAITENKGSRLLHFEGLDWDVAQELYRRGQQYDVCMHVYTRDSVYVFNLGEDERKLLSKRMQIQLISNTDLNFLAGQEIAKLLYVNTDYNYLKAVEEQLQDMRECIDVSFSSNRYMEFNKKGVNKGAGLLNLCGILGIPYQESIAIGDNFNDLPMIEAAGLGVGVKNAVDGIKPMCDVITESTNNEDAVAEVIERFVLSSR